MVSHGQVGMKVVMTVHQLCLSPLDPHHLQLAVHTRSQGFLAGGTEQPKTGVGGIWLSHRWVMAGEEQGDIRTGQQERAAAAK